VIKNPRLKELSDIVEASRERARALASGLSRAQLDWQPGSGRWGVGQCLEHLVVSHERMAPPIREALDRIRAGARPPTYDAWKPGFLGGLLIRSIDPAIGKRRMKTGRAFQPGPAARPDVLSAFDTCQEELLSLLAEADGLDVTAAKIASPMSRLIRYHVGDALTITAVHLPRHLAQAERVKSEPDFPRA
jgi:hypothetical protein